MTIENLNEIALSIIREATKRVNNGAIIIALFGDLGAGKTTLTKEIAKIIGVKENIISPTFVIMKMYDLDKNKLGVIVTPFNKLIHIDAYRLKDETELNHLGFDVLSKDKNNIIVIEWPEIVDKCLDDNVFRVLLTHKDDTTRMVKFLI